MKTHITITLSRYEVKTLENALENYKDQLNENERMSHYPSNTYQYMAARDIENKIKLAQANPARWTVAKLGTNNRPVILIDPACYSDFTGYEYFTHDTACKHAQELRRNNPGNQYIVTETYEPPTQKG